MREGRNRALWVIAVSLLLAGCEQESSAMTFQRLDPDFGGLQGGKTVRVVGENVRLDIGYAVYFGKQRSAQVSIQNEQALLAVTPRRFEAGRVDVTVRADNGAFFVLKGGFEYIDQGGSLLEASGTQ
jgi:hypothetical protein